MKLNNRLIFGLLSVLLAGLIAFVAIPVMNRQANGKTEIVRFTRIVEKGSRITADDIETAEVGRYNLPPNLAMTEEDAVGQYAAADFDTGDYILLTKLSSVPIGSDIRSIPSGKVAISLTIKSLASGLSDKLQPGDIVRIYHYKDVPTEIPELQFVEVLSVTDSRGVNVDHTREPVTDEEKRMSASITVLASPEQAKIITGIENDGVAHVALLSRGDDKLAAELLSMQEAVLAELLAPPETNDDEVIDFDEEESQS